MRETMLLLERRIQDDLRTIEEIYRSLDATPLSSTASEETAIVAGYRLHNLYNAIENIFGSIAEAFENQLDDRSRWHRELLRRMTLDLLPVRPAVIDEHSYELLDELLRFRHLFRAAYGIQLDPERVVLVLRKAMELREPFARQIEKFLDFVRGVQVEDGS
ncbi:MAG: hypothetical protein ACLF0P_18135 [Thermoanaerobaculia bacterium]